MISDVNEAPEIENVILPFTLLRRMDCLEIFDELFALDREREADIADLNN